MQLAVAGLRQYCSGVFFIEADSPSPVPNACYNDLTDPRRILKVNVRKYRCCFTADLRRDGGGGDEEEEGLSPCIVNVGTVKSISKNLRDGSESTKTPDQVGMRRYFGVNPMIQQERWFRTSDEELFRKSGFVKWDRGFGVFDCLKSRLTCCDEYVGNG